MRRTLNEINNLTGSILDLRSEVVEQPSLSRPPNFETEEAIVRLVAATTDSGGENMEIDKDHIVTQEETGERAPIDQVEERVEAEMKMLQGQAKKLVGDGLQDPELAREGERLKAEGEQELKESKDQSSV